MTSGIDFIPLGVIGYTNEFGFVCLDCTGRLLDSCESNKQRDDVLESRHLEPMGCTARARTIRCMLCSTIINHIPHEVEPTPSPLENLVAEFDTDFTQHEGKFAIVGTYDKVNGVIYHHEREQIVNHRPHEHNVVYTFIGPCDWENCPLCTMEAHFVDNRRTSGG